MKKNIGRGNVFEMTKREKIIYPIFLVLIIVLLTFLILKVKNEKNITLIIPEREDILTEGYPTNQSGETYGPSIREWNQDPDLILATGNNNIVGYVKNEDLIGDLPSTPEEAIKKNSNNSYSIPLYLQDGKTIIGEFLVTSPHQSDN